MNEDKKLDAVLDLLQRRRAKANLQDALRDRGCPFSGTWNKVRERAKSAVKAGDISIDSLLVVLNEAESFGHQHVFLYRGAPALAQDLRDQSSVHTSVKQLGFNMASTNAGKLIVAPAEPTLGWARYNANVLVLKWVETRRWLEPIEETEEVNEGRTFVLKKYEQKTGRAVVILKVDLRTRHIELRIQKLESGSDYKKELRKYTAIVRPLLDLDAIPEVNLTVAIRPILESPEVRLRRAKIQTADGCQFEMISPSPTESYVRNDFYKAGHKGLGADFYGRLANVYWLPAESGGKLTTEVHSVIYEGNAIAIPAAISRGDFEYVLGRVRSFAASDS